METKVRVLTVTPEMAQAWLTENRYEHQRYLRSSHVKFLAEEIQRGTFKPDTAIEFTHVDGDSWLTDGQHRLAAVVWAKTAQRFVVIDRYTEDEHQAALDYTRTDQVIVRSISDAYKTLSLEAELGLTSSQVTALGVAVALIDRKFANTTHKMHPDDRLRLMREYNDACGDYLEVVAGSRKELRHRLYRGATLAVALVTFRYSAMVYGKEKVEEFWNGMAMDDGLRTDDARKTALRHLMEMGMIGGASITATKTVTPAFSSRYLATCFNAYINGKELRFAKPNTAEPIIILGSPFNGK